MFSNCNSLIELPDISKWNTKNIKDMSYLFYNCSSITYLPDISKWKTDNIINIKSMLMGCSSLLILPDISKWNINYKIEISNAFSLSSDNSDFNIKTIECNKSSSLSIQSKDNCSSSLENNNDKGEIYYKNFNIFEKENGKELDDYYENFYN